MNELERRAALQNIYKLSGYYNSISGVLGIDQWGGLPERGVPYRLEVNDFLNDQRRTLYFTPEADELAEWYKTHPIGEMTLRLRRFAAF